MSPVAKNIVKVSDFKEFEYSIFLKNNVSLNEILDSTKIRIIELMAKGMTISIPAGTCGSGQNLTLFIFTNKSKLKLDELPDPKKEKKAMMITCKVSKVEISQDNLRSLATLEFLQFTSFDWRTFCNKFGALQKQADKIFKIIKE